MVALEGTLALLDRSIVPQQILHMHQSLRKLVLSNGETRNSGDVWCMRRLSVLIAETYMVQTENR